MKVKETIAEIMRCRLVDPARAATLQEQLLKGGSAVHVDPNDNPDLKAARAMFGIVVSKN